MRVLLLKQSDLDSLRWAMTDRSQMRVRVENALRVSGVKGGQLTEQTDKVVEGLEKWVRSVVDEWVAEVSK